ncbi:phage tail family protein [Cytobacillus firmus]|nr:phage tail family protein [Cytobacillus firmus]
MKFFLIFGGVSSEGIFKITEIRRPILPPLQDITMKVNGRPGLISLGQHIDMRVIEVDIVIPSEDRTDFRKKVEKVADFLYSQDTKTLQFFDDMERIYFARVTGDTNIEQVVNMGKGTITFVCFDPLKYAAEPTILLDSSVLNNSSFVIRNQGNQPVKPVIAIRNTKPIPGNYCTNPGFEVNKNGWTFQNTGGSTGSLARDTSTFFKGAASGKLAKTNTTTAIPRCFFVFSGYQVGKIYPFEAYVKSDVLDGLKVYAEEEDPVNWIYKQVSPTVYSGAAGSWSKISFDVTPTMNGGNIYIFFEAFKAGAYNSWIDEVYMFTDQMNVISNPRIELGNEFIQYTGDLGNGDELVLDFDKWTAKLNTTNVLKDITGDFFEVPVGDQSFTFKVKQGDAEIEYMHRNRWL